MSLQHAVGHSAYTPDSKPLSEMAKPHVSSFDYMLDEGLAASVKLLEQVTIDADEKNDRPRVRLWIESAEIGFPTRTGGAYHEARIFPNECRESGETYSGPLEIKVCRQIGEGPIETVIKRVGDCPIMLKSSKCHLAKLTGPELIRRREEEREQGGYFVLNGIERLVRLLIMPRRNIVLGIQRSSYAKRGHNYSSLATTCRSVRPDQSAITVTVHYLTDGNCTVRFSVRKQEFLLPAVLVFKALVDTTDQEIYNKLVANNTQNTFLTDRVELMLRESAKLNLKSRRDHLAFLGKYFRVLLQPPAELTDEEVGEKLLQDYLFVHCTNNAQKFELLIFMMQKLFAMAVGDVLPDNIDALHTQEVLLPGHLYQMFLKEKLYDWLVGVKAIVTRELRMNPSKVNYHNDAFWKKAFDKQADIGKKIEYFLKTGNLVSQTGLDLMQVSGFTVVADRLNANRYMSHFRSIHRGQFFTTMKTTTVRKLLPESWGFVCPVHTPDGAPCGLLNHLSHTCQILSHPCNVPDAAVLTSIASLGMRPIDGAVLPWNYVTVLLNGRVVGKVPPKQAQHFADQVRLLKIKGPSTMVQGIHGLPRHTEVAVMLSQPNTYDSILISTDTARMIRPVKHLATGDIEWIGPLEQVYMEIAVTDSDERLHECTHVETKPTNFLSINASFVPFPDHNQSPRNMYQCQMGKQTMGTPLHAFPHRADNKLYRIQNPQLPLVYNETHKDYHAEEYPAGANAVVAVISYTGYDMEDACIISKGSYERGFGHASVYAVYVVDLAEFRIKGEPVHHRFGNRLPNRKGRISDKLDEDGLVHIGTKVEYGDPLYCIIDDTNKRAKIVKHKSLEPAIVDTIRIVSPSKGDDSEMQLMMLTLRYNRNPVIGDKFSSRHGQKGVLSVLWPQESMPFTESGMQPDTIINPHAFPSRMTIGMLIESMAAKSGALHGLFQNGTPFRFNENFRAVDFFGAQLRQAGYSYYGSEPMYSGITGELFAADIYIGVVYYQRLRHMVSDKSQVRATGPVNPLTRQPVKGRKKHGGIRFGEMERDSLIAHGVAFTLHDRLMNSSDAHVAPICTQCGSFLSPIHVPAMGSTGGALVKSNDGKIICRNCRSAKTVQPVAIPYVFIYLVNELAAMNIRITLDVK